MLQMPSYEQKFRFKKAMSALQLTPNVHEEHLRPLHPTSIRLPEPARKEYDEDPMSSSSHLSAGLDREAQGEHRVSRILVDMRSRYLKHCNLRNGQS